MSVTPEQTAALLLERTRVEKEHARKRADELLAKLPDAAGLLREAGAGRVWVFGSLASGTSRVESDVDLATEGLPGDRYFDVLAALMTLFGTRVDLVRIESARESLRERITACGRAL